MWSTWRYRFLQDMTPGPGDDDKTKQVQFEMNSEEQSDLVEKLKGKQPGKKRSK